MNAHGGEIAPDHYTISNIIDIHCLMGEATLAAQLVQDLIENGAEIRPHYINNVMNAFRKKHDSDSVLRYLKLFEDVGLARDNSTYNILMSMYGFEHDIANVEKTLDDMIHRDIPITRFTIGLLIRIYFENNLFEKANEWYAQLKTRGMFPSAQILSTMIRMSVLQKQNLQNSLFYYNLACNLKITNIQLCNEQALALLVSGMDFESAIKTTTLQIKNNSLKPNSKTLWIFVDSIIRPSSLENHLKPFGTIVSEMEHVSHVRKGKDYIEKLYADLVSQKSYIPSNLKGDYETALLYLN
jgi:pentatricopeptide repeat protein